MMSRFIYTLLIVVASIAVYAQQEEGELKPVEIEIVKERQITLPQANRLFDKVPPRPVEPIKPEITYSFRSLTFNTPEANPSIRPLRLKQDDNREINGGFLSVGYGNYASPMIEGFINTKQDKNKLLGAHAFLNSSAKGPVDGRNSGSGNSGLSLFAQSFGKDITFEANAGFENQRTHFYGYPEGALVSRDTILQSFNLFKTGLSIANARNTNFSYNLGGSFSYLADHFSARESSVDLKFASAYKIADDNLIEINATYALINRKDEGIDAKGRNLLQVNPFYSFLSQNNLKVKIGMVLALENDTLDSKNFHFFPDVSVVYPLTNSVDVVGTLTGGVDKVSLQSLTRENLWLAPRVPIYHTNKLFDLQAALNARLGSNVIVGTGLSFASLQNLYFFINDVSDDSKFTTVFDDGSTKRTNFFASVAMSFATRTKLSLRGDYFAYSTDNIPEPWHRPGYRFTASGSFSIKDKIILSSDLIALGNIKSFDPGTLQTVKLDPALDLNFRIEYFVSKRFSAFADFNNITATSYQVLLNYPVRGFQVTGGITWSF